MDSVRERLMKKVSELVNDCKTPDDLKPYKIRTKNGYIMSINYERNEIIFFDEDDFGYQNRTLFTGLKSLKIGIILQIIEGLKLVNQYDKMIDNLKSKEDYWDSKKGKWTYKPIDKDKVMGLARSYILERKRPDKYVAKLTKS